jgi:hypothetical protein
MKKQLAFNLLKFRSAFPLTFDDPLLGKRPRITLKLVMDDETQDASISTGQSICYICNNCEPPIDMMKLKHNWYENAEPGPSDFNGKETTVQFPNGDKCNCIVKQTNKNTLIRSKDNNIVPEFLAKNLPKSVKLNPQKFNDDWTSCENEYCKNDPNYNWCHDACYAEQYKYCLLCTKTNPLHIAKEVVGKLYKKPPLKIPRKNATGGEFNRIRTAAVEEVTRLLSFGKECNLAKRIEAQVLVDQVMKDTGDIASENVPFTNPVEIDNVVEENENEQDQQDTELEVTTEEEEEL